MKTEAAPLSNSLLGNQFVTLASIIYLCFVGGCSNEGKWIQPDFEEILNFEYELASHDWQMSSLATYNRKVWAVGNGGRIVFSDDGQTWKEVQDSGTDLSLYGIYGNGDRLWAVGQAGTIVFSDDGQTWKEVLNSGTDLPLYGIYGNEDGLWAVGYEGTIVFSNDGQTWKEVLNSGTNFDLSSIYGKGDSLWAVGYEGTIVFSKDGQTWKEVQDSGTDLALYGIHGNEDGLWAVGPRGTIVFSDNGQTWKEVQDSGTDLSLYGIYGNGDRLWAVGQAGTIVFSDEGQTWKEVQDSGTYLTLYGIHGNEDGLWAVGQAGTIVFSDDGQTWKEVQDSGTYQSLNGIYGNAVGLWAVGKGGTIIFSENGQVWEKVLNSGTNFDLRSIYGNKDGLWAVGDDGMIVFSEDGQTWKEVQDSGTDLLLYGIYGNEDGLWAVGYEGTIVFSKDGQTWKEVLIHGAFHDLYSIYGNEDGLWAVGNGGRIVFSDNGQTWKEVQDSGTDLSLYGIYGNGDRLWAVGREGTIVFSDDGQTWKEVQDSGTDLPLYGICGNGDGLWAVGVGTIVFSENGQQWSSVYSLPYVSDIDAIFEHRGKVFIVNNSPNYSQFLAFEKSQSISGKPQNIIQLSQFRYNITNAALGKDSLTFKMDLRYNIGLGNLEVKSIEVRAKRYGNTAFHSIPRSISTFEMVEIDTFQQSARIKLAVAIDDLEDSGVDVRLNNSHKDVRQVVIQLSVPQEYAFISRTFVLGDPNCENGQCIELKTSFVGDHPYEVLVIGGVFLLYGSVLLLWLLAPLSLLFLHRKLPLSTLIKDLPAPLNSILFFLNILFPFSMIALSNRVLNAWVSKHQNTLGEKFYRNALGEERGDYHYVDLPIKIESPDRGIQEDQKPSIETLDHLFFPERSIIQIVGEGGSGKSTLAKQIAKWLLSEKASFDYRKFLKIPVWIGQLSPDNLDLTKEVEGEIRSIFSKNSLPPGLVEQLLKQQRLVIFIDALSEQDRKVQTYIDNIHKTQQVNAILITSRNKFDFNGSNTVVVNPMSLDAAQTTYMVESLLNHQFEEDLKSKHWLTLKIADRLSELIFRSTDGSNMYPILINLMARTYMLHYRLLLKRSDAEDKSKILKDALSSLPGSIPGVYLQYLASLNRELGNAKDNNRRNELVLRLTSLIAKETIGASFVPGKKQEEDLRKVLTAGEHSATYLKELTKLEGNEKYDLIRQLCESGILQEETVGIISIRFTLDPLEEMLAAHWYCEHFRNRPDHEWQSFVQEVLSLEYQPSGFIKALYQLANSQSILRSQHGWKTFDLPEEFTFV